MKKKYLIVIGIITFLIVFSHAILWQGGFHTIEIKNISELASKASALKKSGGKIEITLPYINGYISMKTKEGIKKGPLFIKGMYIKSDNDDYRIYVPSKVGAINVLISCRANMEISDGYIKIIPYKFSLGLVPIPKGMVFNKLKGIEMEEIEIKNGEIMLSCDMLPFEFDSIVMDKGIISATIVKEEEKPQSGGVVVNTDTKKNLLVRASKQLNGVLGDVSSEGQKSVVSLIISTVNKMAANPNYNYNSDVQAVKSKYNSLSQEERNGIKDAIFENMDMSTLKQVKNTFGL